MRGGGAAVVVRGAVACHSIGLLGDAPRLPCTHIIAGRTVEISEAPRFNKRRPARYLFTIAGTAAFAQNNSTYSTVEDALAAASHDLGVTANTDTCTHCGRTATMTNSLGKTCDVHFDTITI